MKSPHRIEVENFFQRHPNKYFNVVEIQEALGLDIDLIRSVVGKLVNESLVTHYKAKGLGHYCWQRQKAKKVDRHVPAGYFYGVDWTTATLRPGCMDHLKHPSKRPDGEVFHSGKYIV